MANKFDLLIKHPDHDIVLKGIRLNIRDGVFSPEPDLTNSSSIILNHMPDLTGKRVLDVGTGTGILAIRAAKLGAREVVAVDTSEKAVKNAEENVEASGFNNIHVVQSDLFANVVGSFDVVLANLPIDDNLWERDEMTKSTASRFLERSGKYLEENGAIYLTWFSISDVNAIRELISDNGYKYAEETEEKFNFTWHLFEITKKP